jgi:hypothetical protein
MVAAPDVYAGAAGTYLCICAELGIGFVQGVVRVN